MQYCEARAVECPLEQTIKLQGELVTTGRQEVCSRQQGSLRLYRGQAGVRQGSGRNQTGVRKGSAGPHPSNLPANPDHEGSKKVAWQVLNDRKGRHKDDQHEKRHNVAIDARIHSRPHGEDGLTKDVAAGEASTRNGSCHV